MPQLNPQPWFFLFLAVWIIFTILMLPNTLKSNNPHLPNPKSLKNNLNLKIKN